jgi:hypothetical protein
VVDDSLSIDGNLWGQWVRAGSERWEVARRSWTVFTRNTTELIDLVKMPATNIALALQLMGDDRETTEAFWEELDQRLHNQLASAASLIDHLSGMFTWLFKQRQVVNDGSNVPDRFRIDSV